MNTTLAASFVKAQKGFAPALKSSTNQHFKSKYVDLAGCVEAVIDSLNSNGIALIQNTHESENGVVVETIFLHESGETLSCGKLHVPAAKHDAQGFGSALTYARRYSLMAACGIAPEDDDANSAVKASPAPSQADVSNAIAVLNTAAQRGSKAFELATKSMAESLKAAIPPQVKKDLYAAAKSMDEGVEA